MYGGESELILSPGSAKPGEGKTYDDALKDAYERGKRDHPGKNCFRVVETWVCGNNPVTDYKVWVTPI